METQEIFAGTKDAMYHEDSDEDKDVLQIWDQKHRSIEVEDETETALEETSSQTQEIPAGDQEDQDMLLIWDQKHQSIEDAYEIKDLHWKWHLKERKST